MSRANGLAEAVLCCPPECIEDHETQLVLHTSQPVAVTTDASVSVWLAWDTDQSPDPRVAIGDDSLSPAQARDLATVLVQHADRAEHGTPIPEWTPIGDDDE